MAPFGLKNFLSGKEPQHNTAGRLSNQDVYMGPGVLPGGLPLDPNREPLSSHWDQQAGPMPRGASVMDYGGLNELSLEDGSGRPIMTNPSRSRVSSRPISRYHSAEGDNDIVDVSRPRSRGRHSSESSSSLEMNRVDNQDILPHSAHEFGLSSRSHRRHDPRHPSEHHRGYSSHRGDYDGRYYHDDGRSHRDRSRSYRDDRYHRDRSYRDDKGYRDDHRYHRDDDPYYRERSRSRHRSRHHHGSRHYDQMLDHEGRLPTIIMFDNGRGSYDDAWYIKPGAAPLVFEDVYGNELTRVGDFTNGDLVRREPIVLDQYGGPPPFELMGGSGRHSSKYRMSSHHRHDRRSQMYGESPESSPWMFSNHPGSGRHGSVAGSHYGPHVHPTPMPMSLRRSPDIDRGDLAHMDPRGLPSADELHYALDRQLSMRSRARTPAPSPQQAPGMSRAPSRAHSSTSRRSRPPQ